MNALSWILIGIAALWFIAAVVWIVRRKRNVCACGSKCSSCEQCNQCKRNRPRKDGSN